MKSLSVKSQIAEAVQDAVKLIAAQAESARAVVAANAAEAAKILAAKNESGKSDHDLVQRIDTKVDAIIVTIAKLEAAQNVYVTKSEHLEVHAEVARIQADHETRTRVLEDNMSDLNVIKRLVYGCVGTILILVLTAIVYLVVQR